MYIPVTLHFYLRNDVIKKLNCISYRIVFFPLIFSTYILPVRAVPAVWAGFRGPGPPPPPESTVPALDVHVIKKKYD